MHAYILGDSSAQEFASHYGRPLNFGFEQNSRVDACHACIMPLLCRLKVGPNQDIDSAKYEITKRELSRIEGERRAFIYVSPSLRVSDTNAFVAHVYRYDVDTYFCELFKVPMPKFRGKWSSDYYFEFSGDTISFASGGIAIYD